MPVAIVTDSTSDVPIPFMEELNIFQIPAVLQLEDQEYQDGPGLSRKEFYQRLPFCDPLPTTAAPAVGLFQDLYDTVLTSGFSQILSIHAASNLSGIFNAARLAASKFQDRIHVIDSRQLSLGLGFQVIEAARAARDKLPVEKILGITKSVRRATHVYALLDTFKYIHRSGRVSWAKAQMGALLNIKPIVELRDGVVYQRGLTRTRRNGIRRLGEFLIRLGPLKNLAVLHTNAEQEGKEFQEIYQQLSLQDPILVNVTTIIGTHVGPGGLGFAAVVK